MSNNSTIRPPSKLALKHCPQEAALRPTRLLLTLHLHLLPHDRQRLPRRRLLLRLAGRPAALPPLLLLAAGALGTVRGGPRGREAVALRGHQELHFQAVRLPQRQRLLLAAAAAVEQRRLGGGGVLLGGGGGGGGGGPRVGGVASFAVPAAGGAVLAVLGGEGGVGGLLVHVGAGGRARGQGGGDGLQEAHGRVGGVGGGGGEGGGGRQRGELRRAVRRLALLLVRGLAVVV